MSRIRAASVGDTRIFVLLNSVHYLFQLPYGQSLRQHPHLGVPFVHVQALFLLLQPESWRSSVIVVLLAPLDPFPLETSVLTAVLPTYIRVTLANLRSDRSCPMSR